MQTKKLTYIEERALFLMKEAVSYLQDRQAPAGASWRLADALELLAHSGGDLGGITHPTGRGNILRNDRLANDPHEITPDIESVICVACSGSGEGSYDGSQCYTCRGTGERSIATWSCSCGNGAEGPAPARCPTHREED